MRIKHKVDKNDWYFTADTHFFHKNIVEYCNRPYKDLNSHNKALIENWNNKVPPTGHIIVGGDFAFTGNLRTIEDLIARLNGTIYLILGNHCYKNKFDRENVKDLFEGRVYDTATLEIEDIELYGDKATFFISHYPHMFWQKNTVHLHGHVHSGPNSTAKEIVPFHCYRYDIGVDNNNYAPISYHELKVILTKRMLQCM